MVGVEWSGRGAENYIGAYGVTRTTEYMNIFLCSYNTITYFSDIACIDLLKNHPLSSLHTKHNYLKR